MKRLFFLPIFVILLMPNFSFAQANGEALFKAKCSTCHMVDRNGTGPALQGARAKWDDAGESALLYEWVYNSGQLLSTGKSKMAAAIQNYSGTNMPAQQVNKEEVDAIFAYIDGWEKGPDNPKEMGVTVTDYSSYDDRLTMTYILVGLLVLLLIAISMTSKVMIRLMQKGIQLKKIKSGNVTARVAFLISAVFVFLYWMAPDGISNGTGISETPPWLMVETYQLYILLAINIALVIVLYRLKSLLQIFYVKPN